MRLKPLVQLGTIHTQSARKQIGGDLEIRNLLRIDGHRVGRQGLRQRLPGAVQDGPAQGLHFLGSLLLLFGQAEQFVVPDYLQPDQPPENDARPREQRPQQPLKTLGGGW